MPGFPSQRFIALYVVESSVYLYNKPGSKVVAQSGTPSIHTFSTHISLVSAARKLALLLQQAFSPQLLWTCYIQTCSSSSWTAAFTPSQIPCTETTLSFLPIALMNIDLIYVSRGSNSFLYYLVPGATTTSTLLYKRKLGIFTIIRTNVLSYFNLRFTSRTRCRHVLLGVP